MEIQFEALGTAWHITIDELNGSSSTSTLEDELRAKTAAFERQFSRFLPDSEVNQWRDAKPGTYPISAEFTTLLTHAEKLRQLTDGAFDPAIATLLELAGYDAQYKLKPQQSKMQTWQVPQWSIDAAVQTITIDGPVVFDLGGFGKGYWIDQLAAYLKQQGYTYFLVEGGGDMVATTKASGEGYIIALEWPGRPDMAIGMVVLQNQGLAASDTFRRRWGKWNHLIDSVTKQPIEQLHGVIAIASSALQADQLTSLIALSDPNQYSARAQTLGGEYLVVLADQTIHVSSGWPGELF